MDALCNLFCGGQTDGMVRWLAFFTPFNGFGKRMDPTSALLSSTSQKMVNGGGAYVVIMDSFAAYRSAV